jgi:hypothetical protein
MTLRQNLHSVSDSMESILGVVKPVTQSADFDLSFVEQLDPCKLIEAYLQDKKKLGRDRSPPTNF